MKNKIQFANEGEKAQCVAFVNDIGEISEDGWGQLAPFGNFPGVAIIPQKDGSYKRVPSIQRIDRESSLAMVSKFKSTWQKMKRFVTGCPIFDGHSDVPTIANDYPDKVEKGTIVDLDVRSDGLYCKPVFTNEGNSLIENRQRRAFSGYWDAEEIGEENGVKIYRPTTLLSAALTNRPNLPVQLLNEAETQKNQKEQMKKTVIIEFLTAQGITIANEATEEQVSEALQQLGEKAKTAATLANEKAAWEREKTSLNSGLAAKDTEINTLKTDVTTANTKFANARKEHINHLTGLALTSGRITAADKTTWETRLANEATFANESTAILALKPVVKTESVTVQIGSRTVSIANATERREVTESLVADEMKTNGGDYAKAYTAIQRKHPALFENMKQPKLQP